MKTIERRTPAAIHIKLSEMPSHQTDTMCRILTGYISRFFENPDVKADYERWKKENHTT